MTEQYVKPEYPLSAVTARIIAAAREVHRELGPGCREIFCQRALARELPCHGLEFSREEWIEVWYKDAKLGRMRVDFVVDDVMVEIKARTSLEPVAYAQTLSYLRASGYKIGLLLNSGALKLEVKRLVN